MSKFYIFKDSMLEIDQVIINGVQVNRKLKATLSNRKGVMDHDLYDVIGYQCPRCRGACGYTCRDAIIHTAVWFCASNECLSHDKQCSISIARKERLDFAANAKEKKPFDHMPARFQLATLAKWEAIPAYHDKALGWLKKPVDFLILTGASNTGKTFFCCACYNWLHQYHEAKDIAWVDSKILKNKIYASIEKGGYFPILEKYCNEYEILIIDDIDEFGISEWQREVITAFIDMLYERQKKCIITSSTPLNNLQQRIGSKAAGKFQKMQHLDMDDMLVRIKKGEV